MVSSRPPDNQREPSGRPIRKSGKEGMEFTEKNKLLIECDCAAVQSELIKRESSKGCLTHGICPTLEFASLPCFHLRVRRRAHVSMRNRYQLALLQPILAPFDDGLGVLMDWVFLGSRGAFVVQLEQTFQEFGI